MALRKVVLVGDSGVGKTAILSRFMTGSMPPARRATMGATEKMKSVHVPSLNKRLPLQVWDITGNEKFRTLTSIYFRDADVEMQGAFLYSKGVILDLFKGTGEFDFPLHQNIDGVF